MLEETHICFIETLQYILNSLGMQQATADVLHKVSFHPSNTNILVVYLVVAFLQGNYTPIPIRLKQRLTTLDLRHFVWNIGERLGTKNGYNGYARADFIKAMFPDVMKDIEQDSIRNFKFQPNKGSIVIDEPDEDDFRFHIK